MYDKFTGVSQTTAECAEEMADVLFELGKDLQERKHFDVAASWLERALNTIDSQDLDRLSEHAGDLRLSIMQRLGQLRHPQMHMVMLTSSSKVPLVDEYARVFGRGQEAAELHRPGLSGQACRAIA